MTKLPKDLVFPMRTSHSTQPHEFVCADCGHSVHGIPHKGNRCAICHWLITNEYLTDNEREKLRYKLLGKK